MRGSTEASLVLESEEEELAGKIRMVLEFCLQTHANRVFVILDLFIIKDCDMIILLNRVWDIGVIIDFDENRLRSLFSINSYLFSIYIS